MKNLLSQEMEKSLGMTGLDWEHQQRQRLNWQTQNGGSGRYWGVRERCQARGDCRDLGADWMGKM